MFCRGTRGEGRETRFTILIVFLFVFQFSFSQSSCTCDETKIAFSQAYVASHQLIFRGKTVSVESGVDYGKVHFIVTQLFKGSASKELTLYYDAKTACQLKFSTGEDWLIYADFKQLQKPFVEYCSRSRKNVINTNKNVESMYVKSDLTIDDECEQLRDQLGLQQFASQSEESNRHSNIIPGFWQRIVLVIFSILGFVAIYFVTVKFLRK
jgi:hypothetical protein